MFHFLVVDDNQSFRKVVRSAILNRFPDADIVQAQDGQQAIILALTHRPDLILLDESMPVMNGRETAEILRLMPATRCIPLIAISGESPDSFQGNRLRQFCDFSISKPFSFNLLVSVIEVVLKRSKNRPIPDSPLLTLPTQKVV